MAKLYLKNRIATHNVIDYDTIDSKENNNKEVEEILLSTEDEFKCITIHEDIKYIYDTCLVDAQINGHIGDHDNFQYDPSITKKLCNFCRLLPCWSAVMTPYFKYGKVTESSATSESLFKDLKSVVFKHKTLPIRIDEFLNIHVTSIIGNNCIIQSKITKNELNNKMEEFKNEFYVNSDDVIEEDIENNILENWRGLGEPEIIYKL